ncbi:GNAT family N-acetyltransferase [Microbulbifer epialgicus]|uniref:N-acetyltransferase family protein n=1 Tax=Microbulbifer epialgicus TaxID=393907 RepID=A0ABV4P733_9GAMM
MKIRVATLSDIQAISEIHATSWRKNYQNVLTKEYLIDKASNERHQLWKGRFNNPKPNQQVLLAIVEGEIAGFVSLYASENPHWGSYLDNLHVREKYHSKGIGKALLIAGARWFYQQDSQNGMCLLVNQDNIKAQEFYKKLGARNVEASIWNAPDGSIVPTYWFVWDTLNNLIEAT